MAVYRLAYDMNVPGERRKKITKYIEEQAAWGWVQISETDYVISVSGSNANAVWNTHFAKFFDDSDRALLIEVKGNYQGLLTEEQWKYLDGFF